MSAESLIDRARTEAEAAEANRIKTLERIATQEAELLTVERTLNRSIDADEVVQLSARDAALRIVVSRAREGLTDVEQKAREERQSLKNLEREAERLRDWLGATEAHPASAQEDAEYLKRLEIETASKLAEMTGKPEGQNASFITSYLRLEGHEARKTAIAEFFSDWLGQEKRYYSSYPQASRLESVTNLFTELRSDRSRMYDKLSNHEQAIASRLARLVNLIGEVDLETLRRERRERELVALLDLDTEAEKQRTFQAALAEAEQELQEAIQHREKVEREMREHAEALESHRQELAHILEKVGDREVFRSETLLAGVRTTIANRGA